MVVPLVGLGVALAGTLVVHYLTASVERAQTRDLFSRFVPDSVVAQVLERADTEDDVRLGGELLTATVLFSDLRGFTSFAEGREPAEVIGVLNRYLTEMSDAILDHDGTLVAYMGDGIMAVFGAPIASDDHADKALGAAREMLERLERLQRVAALRRPRRRVQDGHRAQLGRRDVGQRRLRAAAGVHDHRRYNQLSGAFGGHDQGHALPAVRGRLDARAARARRRTTSSRWTSSRCAGARAR